MHEINLKNRLVFDNIFIKRNDSFVLLNLYSFRRMQISYDDLHTLLNCNDKIDKGIDLDSDETRLYNLLTEKKQIITDDVLAAFLKGKAEEHEKNLSTITPKISRITISPTFACNFNCEYCYQRKFSCKSDYISADAIDNVCEVIRKINNTDNYLDGIVRVTINGGEPLQHKNIETINRILECFAHPGVALTLLTNGYNIIKFKDLIDFSKFESIQVSLDNVDPFARKINGVNHSVFSEVLEGLSFLMKCDCNITIASILSRDLLENIDEFIKQLSSIGIVDNSRCEINISPVASFGKSTLDDSFYTINEYIELKRLLKAKKLPSNLRIGGIPEARWIDRALKRKSNVRIDGRPSMCSILTNRSIHFAPNGQMYWCLCVKPDVGSLGQYYPSINVDMSKITECIHKSVYSNEKCKSCAYKYLCSSGCPLYSVASTGTYSSPFCGFFNNPEFWQNLEDILE